MSNECDLAGGTRPIQLDSLEDARLCQVMVAWLVALRKRSKMLKIADPCRKILKREIYKLFEVFIPYIAGSSLELWIVIERRLIDRSGGQRGRTITPTSYHQCQTLAKHLTRLKQERREKPLRRSSRRSLEMKTDEHSFAMQKSVNHHPVGSTAHGSFISSLEHLMHIGSCHL